MRYYYEEDPEPEIERIPVRSPKEFREAARKYTRFTKGQIAAALRSIKDMNPKSDLYCDADGFPSYPFYDGSVLRLQEEVTKKVGPKAYNSLMLMVLNNRDVPEFDNDFHRRKDFDHCSAIKQSVDSIVKGCDPKDRSETAEDVYNRLLALSKGGMRYTTSYMIIPGPSIFMQYGMNFYRQFVTALERIEDYKASRFVGMIPELMKTHSFEYAAGLMRTTYFRQFYPDEILAPYMQVRGKIRKLRGKDAVDLAFRTAVETRGSRHGPCRKTFLKSLPKFLLFTQMDGLEAYVRCFQEASTQTQSINWALPKLAPYLAAKMNEMNVWDRIPDLFNAIADIIPMNWRMAGFMLADGNDVIKKQGVDGLIEFAKKHVQTPKEQMYALVQKAGTCTKWFSLNQPHGWQPDRW